MKNLVLRPVESDTCQKYISFLMIINKIKTNLHQNLSNKSYYLDQIKKKI